jgi:hypothetical protein
MFDVDAYIVDQRTRSSRGELSGAHRPERRSFAVELFLLWTGLQTRRLHIVGYPFLRNLYWSQVRLRSKLYAVRIFYLCI